MNPFEALADLARQVVVFSGDGENGFHINTFPDGGITLTLIQALSVYGILHFTYAILTHWRSLIQVNRYNKSAPESEQVRDRDKWLFFIGRMMAGLEHKFLVAAVAILNPILCNVLAPLVQGNCAGCFKGYLKDKGLTIRTLRWTAHPKDMRIG